MVWAVVESLKFAVTVIVLALDRAVAPPSRFLRNMPAKMNSGVNESPAGAEMTAGLVVGELGATAKLGSTWC